MNTISSLRTYDREGSSILLTALVGTVLSLGLTARLSAQTITVCRPNGAETWPVGERHAIHWNWTGSISSVDIQYSTDGGGTWDIILSGTTNDGDAIWMVPNTPSANCLVKVASASDPDVYDVSDTSFAIARPVITVKRPNGGETWTVGEKRAVRWDWTGWTSSVDIEFSTDGGGTWNSVLSGVNNDGDALWTVPNTPSTACRVRVTDTADASSFDESDSDFSITRPTISVSRPNGGETYYAGRYAPIHWTSSGSFGAVNLDYSTDGGSSWDVIATGTTNDGDFCWSIPDDLSYTACKVRVTNGADSSSYDVSAANFTISAIIPPDSMHLFSPRTDDSWLAGSYYYICWTRAGSNGYVKLEYSTNSGSTWNSITQSTPNSGAYEWQVPSAPSTVCKMRISNADNPGVYDESDLFTIEKQWILPSSPDTGDSWLVGRYYYITWNWGGQFTEARIQYSTNRGTTWSYISAGTSNSGFYRWQVPEPPSENSQVRITNTANTQVFGVTDVFQAAPQAVVLTSPLTGDVWQAGRKCYITWSCTGQFSDANLWYSLDRGTSWTLITGVNNTGYYEWLVPSANSTNCRIRATKTSNGALLAVSDVFTILPQPGISERASVPVSQNLVAEPNPSQGLVLLRYALTDETPVDLAVFDASGRQVRALVGTRVAAGVHSIAWDRHDQSGRLLPPGVYFCRMLAGEFRAVRKLIAQ
jgi:hypothetical protein